MRLPTVRLAALLLCLCGAASRADAHVSGEPALAGTTLHVWTDPITGAPLPASLLFVDDTYAHVEDVAGRLHQWSLSSLTSEDRALTTSFLERRARLRAFTPRAHDSAPPPVWMTIMACACLSALAAWRTGHLASSPVRMGASLAAAAALFACGGATTTSPTAASPVSATTTTTTTAPTTTTPNPTTPSPAPATPTVASYFTSFPQHVRTRQDDQNLYVESDGLADHVMMAGIRSWQQQVPLPADYTGSNAWTIPLAPRLASEPVSARTGLFRGAIALAVNGVPIFNALNNRGDDAYLAGELDDFGGHSGRADDYHYHTAPLFLSSTVGATRPIGVALDGFALYGALEPDGSAMRPLDDYNGHADGAGGYHYHGTRTYPYINGGMKGVVRVSDQVEPQPSLRAIRPAGTPLAGATITKHTATSANAWTLEYQIAGRTYRVDYRIEGTRVMFVFTDPSGASRTETYTR